MGVKKWIDLQLHPEKLAENPTLETTLAPLETLHLSQRETESTYPTPQMIRAVATGRQPLPDDPIARAAVERLTRRFKVKKDEKDTDPMQPAVPLEKLLTAAQIKTLRTGTPAQKKETLAAIPAEQMDDVVIAMPQGLRGQLMPVAPESLRRKLLLSNNPATGHRLRSGGGKNLPRHPQQPPVAGADGGLLVQPTSTSSWTKVVTATWFPPMNARQSARTCLDISASFLNLPRVPPQCCSIWTTGRAWRPMLRAAPPKAGASKHAVSTKITAANCWSSTRSASTEAIPRRT